MTEISNMVSYYNHPLMYGGGNRVPQHQIQASMSPGSPASSQAMSSPAQTSQDAQQQCSNWYYQHHHHHHHQQQHQHQYLADASAESPMLWPAHAHHPAYLQYQHHHAYQQQQQVVAAAAQQQQSQIDWSSDEANNNSGVGASEPSPAITVSGSEISSPGTPASPSNNNNLSVANNNSPAAQMRSAGNRSPYEWMKKNSYQPNPGKTRTKEKYRVVYTEHQRLELEKEFYSSKYITIRRKAELATSLALSERQVKIWFQNRRAKERKQTKKRSELEQRDVKPSLDVHGVAHAPPTAAPTPVAGMANLGLCSNMNMGGVPSISLNGMMSGIGLPAAPSPTALMAHHHHHHHHQLLGAAVAAAAAAQQQHPQHPSVIGVRTDSAHAL